MRARHEKVREQAIAAIDRIRASVPLGSLAHLDLALTAQAAAKEARDPLLEAEALLQMGKTFAPAVDPARVWASLLHAQDIFETNGLEHKALSCRVAAAQVLFDIGEERNAIAAAESLLSNSRMDITDRAFAHILIALCHSHLGELDVALDRLKHSAYPLAMACHDTKLLSQVLWARGLTYIRLMLHRHNPELFRSWPGMPPIAHPLPPTDHIVSLFREAQAAMPPGREWPYLELGALFAAALSDRSDASLGALFEFSDRHLSIDPPLGARTFFCIGVVLRQRGDAHGALAVFEKALTAAEPMQSTSIVRDVLLHISRIHEGLGNAWLALAAFKRYSEIQLRSLLVPAGYRSFGFRRPEAAPAEQEHPEEMRNLEPALIRRATRFISEAVGTPISVGDVVEHCEVSRRSLESAFKRHKLITIAQSIKQAKIDKATQELRHTKLSVREIAEGLGYRSATAFSQDFRAIYGKTPAKWRNEPL